MCYSIIFSTRDENNKHHEQLLPNEKHTNWSDIFRFPILLSRTRRYHNQYISTTTINGYDIHVQHDIPISVSYKLCTRRGVTNNALKCKNNANAVYKQFKNIRLPADKTALKGPARPATGTVRLVHRPK